MKRLIRALILILALSALILLFLCLRVEKGDAFAVETSYCDAHRVFAVTVVLPERVPGAEDILRGAEAVLPPIFSVPPRILFEMLSDLWSQARSAVKGELLGCVALP